MNILIFIPDLDKKKVGGIWQYATALLKTLSYDKANSYFVYLNNADEEMNQIVAQAGNMQLVNNAGVLHVPVSTKILRRIHQLKHRLFSPGGYTINVLDLLCKKYQIDIVHCPYQYLPQTKLAARIVTLHDVQEIHFPENFSAEDRLYRAGAHLRMVKEADRILVSYQHVKQDLIRYFQADPEKVVVMLLDMKNLWFERSTEIMPDHAPAQNSFLLYPANIWQHKNHLGLAKSVLNVREKYGVEVNIICTGGNSTPWYQTVVDFIRANQLTDNFSFVGAVSNEHLLWYYRHCRAVVIPTFYEAGSFPLMESILMQVPVICANVTSLPETIGDDRFVFNPASVDEMGEKIFNIWGNEAYRMESLENTRIQAPRLSSTGALDLLTSVYRQLSH